MFELWRTEGEACEEGMSLTTTDSSNFVGYCGLYCNACGIRQGKIRTAVKNLRSIISHYGFDKMMPALAKWEPSFQHYGEFTQVMDGLVKMFGECPGCLQSGGDPDCKVRTCAKEKGYRTCAECSEAETCESLAPYRKWYEPLIGALRTIRQHGVDRYAKDMQQRVDEGYSYVEQDK